MKSFAYLFGIGVLSMGCLTWSSPSLCHAEDFSGDAYTAVSSSQVLAEKMHKNGIRKGITLQERFDLQDVILAAQAKAVSVDLECQLHSLYEVRLAPQSEPSTTWVAGYEAYLTCEDAPSPGLALYFDVDHQYLGEFESGT